MNRITGLVLVVQAFPFFIILVCMKLRNRLIVSKSDYFKGMKFTKASRITDIFHKKKSGVEKNEG